MANGFHKGHIPSIRHFDLIDCKLVQVDRSLRPLIVPAFSFWVAHQKFSGRNRDHRHRAGGIGVDAVLDFVGGHSSLELSVGALRAGGELAVVGSGGGELTVRKPGALPPGVRISLPFWGTRPELEEVVALARKGAVRVETEGFALSSAPEAIDRLRSGHTRGRTVLVPG
jgi:D-arabinose 1-dehydrogenase-like Zn-dependent alcohol dehydrogenase